MFTVQISSVLKTPRVDRITTMTILSSFQGNLSFYQRPLTQWRIFKNSKQSTGNSPWRRSWVVWLWALARSVCSVQTRCLCAGSPSLATASARSNASSGRWSRSDRRCKASRPGPCCGVVRRQRSAEGADGGCSESWRTRTFGKGSTSSSVARGQLPASLMGQLRGWATSSPFLPDKRFTRKIKHSRGDLLLEKGGSRPLWQLQSYKAWLPNSDEFCKNKRAWLQANQGCLLVITFISFIKFANILSYLFR